MMDRESYRPLPGRVAGPLYSARMYQGPEHLLKSTVQGFHEHFRRFAWEDIQSLIVEETPWNGVVNVLLILVLLMLVVSYLTFTDKDWRVAVLYLPFLALISGLMLINLRRGATCKVYLQTAVTRERLWSLNRIKVAIEFVEAVAPLIRERQADAKGRAGREAANPASSAAQADPGLPPQSHEARPASVSGPIDREKGRWHLAGTIMVGWFLLANLIDSRLSHTSEVLGFINLAAFAASCMVCLVALVSQSRHRTPRAVRILGFLLLAYHVLLTMIALGDTAASFAALVRDPASVKTNVDPRTSPTYFTVLYGKMVLEAGLLIYGSLTLARLRRINRDGEARTGAGAPA